MLVKPWMFCLEGDQFCLLNGFKRIEVESNALNVVAAIYNFEIDLSMEGSDFDEVRQLKQEFEVISWKKIPRECNAVAHCLARKAILQEGIKFLKEVGPPWLDQIVIDDMSS